MKVRQGLLIPILAVYGESSDVRSHGEGLAREITRPQAGARRQHDDRIFPASQCGNELGRR